MPSRDPKKIEEIFKALGLSAYQSRVLAYAYILGKSKATDLSKASNVPKAKIYSTLDELCEIRLMKKIETKPSLYIPIPPEEALENLREWKNNEIIKEIENIERIKEKNLDLLKNYFTQERYHEEEFLEVIPVGTSSEIETKKLYRRAQKEINIVTRAFEYFPKVKKELEKKSASIILNVLFLHETYLSEKDLSSQKTMIRLLREMGAAVRISEEKLPIRYTLIDPDDEYTTGEVLFLVEETDIPVFMRYCVLSRNHSLAYGFHQYFTALWEKGEEVEP